jgi:hypothetical protein
MEIIQGCNMKTKNQFYSTSDLPTRAIKKRIWKKIKSEINFRHSYILFTIPDKRSFFYGIAAAFLIFFISSGIISTVQNAFESSKPHAVKLDAAYTIAIREFERVMPEIAATSASGKVTDNIISIRIDELKNVDKAIIHLQNDAANGDLSPLKQKRLRQLYSIKLSILQEMVENGEITL